MRIVLDTCVLVAALRSSSGASHVVLRAIRDGKLQMVISVALFMEYQDVLCRPNLLPHLTIKEIDTILNALCLLSREQKVFYTWRPFLQDPDDDRVMELAVAGKCQYIITQNIKDFAGADSMGVTVITPSEALTTLNL